MFLYVIEMDLHIQKRCEIKTLNEFLFCVLR